MFELVLGIVFVILVLVGGGVYLADRPGWNRTLKRVSRMTRASVESRKGGVVALKKRPEGQKALKAEWEAEFTGVAVASSPSLAKHAIVKLDYHTLCHDGLWPQWTCKCGKSAYQVSSRGTYSLSAAERLARKAAETHVREATRIDTLKSSGEKFMF